MNKTVLSVLGGTVGGALLCIAFGLLTDIYPLSWTFYGVVFGLLLAWTTPRRYAEEFLVARLRDRPFVLSGGAYERSLWWDLFWAALTVFVGFVVLIWADGTIPYWWTDMTYLGIVIAASLIISAFIAGGSWFFQKVFYEGR